MAKNAVKYEGAFTQDTRLTINQNLPDISLSTVEFDADSGTTADTLTNVTGLVSGVLQPGTYNFKLFVQGLSTANGGMKLALKFGTASMLTSLSLEVRAFTASGVAVTRATTATDAAAFLASTAAIINADVEGIIVVGTAGTLQLQAAQNASHADNTVIYVGSSMSFTQIV